MVDFNPNLEPLKNPYFEKISLLNKLLEEEKKTKNELSIINSKLNQIRNEILQINKTCTHFESFIYKVKYLGQQPGSGKSEYQCLICKQQI